MHFPSLILNNRPATGKVDGIPAKSLVAVCITDGDVDIVVVKNLRNKPTKSVHRIPRKRKKITKGLHRLALTGP